MLIRRCFKFMITVGQPYGTEFKVTLLLLNVFFPFGQDFDDNFCSFNGYRFGYRLGKCKL